MKPKLLIDIDETVYPFLHTWDEWLRSKQELGVDWESFAWWYDLDLYLEGHLEKQEEFIAAHAFLRPQPIPEAEKSLLTLKEHFTISALTARNKADWQGETESWINQHLPFVEDIFYNRAKRGSSAVPKGRVAEKLNAKALVDDTSYWIQTLPSQIDGYIVKRPTPLASDAGAIHWNEIESLLLKK
jgi:hypothetical protein